MSDDSRAVQAAYDRVAEPYAARFLGELEHKPLDRALLGWFAELVRGAGPVADLGAGPGQTTRFLHERGVEVYGVDLSPAMVALARERHRDRGLEFRVGDLRALPLRDGALAGALAFYAYVHVPQHQLAAAFQELARVLRPGAPALLAFHLGEETLHVDEFLGHPVALDFHLFSMSAVVAAAAMAGLVAEARLERAPYQPHEHPTPRGYLLLRARP